MRDIPTSLNHGKSAPEVTKVVLEKRVRNKRETDNSMSKGKKTNEKDLVVSVSDPRNWVKVGRAGPLKDLNNNHLDTRRSNPN